ncbi:MAG: phage tail protein [Bacteroidota bacterium]
MNFIENYQATASKQFPLSTLRLILCVLVTNFLMSAIYAQGVAINTDDSDADASAILDVKSTTQGVIFPRLTSAQRDLISSPAAGLMIFNTDRLCLEYYTGAAWTSGEPAGTIKPYAGGSIPEGWLVCNGTAVSRSTYPDLFTALSVSRVEGCIECTR